MQLEIHLGQLASQPQRRRIGRAKSTEDDEVFQALLKIVADVGYARLTFARIADRVGLTPSALVQRFGSKRALLAAFVEWFNDTNLALLRAALERKAESPLDALMMVPVAVAAGLPNQPNGLANILALFVEFAADPELQPTLASIDRQLEEAIQGLVGAAAIQGQLKLKDPAPLARLLMAAYRGTLIRWAVSPEGSVVDQVRRCVETLLAPYVANSAG